MPSDTPLPIDPVARINELRRRVINNEEVSQQEIAEAISLIRQQRSASSTKADTTASGKPKKKIPLDLNDLFKPQQ